MVIARLIFTLCAYICASIGGKAASANLQVVHNSADPILVMVDVYMNGDLKYNDIQFRTSSGVDQLTFTGSVIFSIAFASSTGEGDAFFRDTVNISDNANIILILTGVLNPALFAPNPSSNAKPTGFDIVVVSNVRTASALSNSVDLFAYHGSTDAIGTDVYANENRVFSDAYYGFATDYITLDADTTVFSVAPIGGNPIAAFRADLKSIEGQSALLIASGFLSPGANQNGLLFRLFLVTRRGGPFTVLASTPPVESASVQIIHNASDPELSVVDLYLGSLKIQDDFAFRSSTPFVSIPANTSLSIGIAPAVSESVQDTVASILFTFNPGRHVVIASGVLDTAQFESNPDVRAPSIKFSGFRIGDVKPNATSPSNTDIIFFHGATDIGSLDLLLNSTTKISSDVVYGSSTGSVSIEAGKYLIGIALTGGQVFDQFYADLIPLAGKSLILMTSGFADPTNNANGADLGMYAATNDGGPMINFPRGTSTVGESASEAHITISPNPAHDYIILSGQQAGETEITVTIASITGTNIFSKSLGNIVSGSWSHTIPTEAVATGIYMVHVKAGSSYSTSPLVIVR
ncbi:MAG: T9SS type A sorting domain-containing protein [Ignavibacteria bacterium]|nr:T9SS type A sorting domain-containing protein [Ignavibacteria bacterium]